MSDPFSAGIAKILTKKGLAQDPTVDRAFQEYTGTDICPTRSHREALRALIALSSVRRNEDRDSTQSS